MIKISTIFGLGVFVAVLQYLGLPLDWKNWLYIISGVLIAVLSLMIRKELTLVLKRLHSDGIKTETFAESVPHEEGTIVENNKLF